MTTDSTFPLRLTPQEAALLSTWARIGRETVRGTDVSELLGRSILHNKPVMLSLGQKIVELLEWAKARSKPPTNDPCPSAENASPPFQLITLPLSFKAPGLPDEAVQHFTGRVHQAYALETVEHAETHQLVTVCVFGEDLHDAPNEERQRRKRQVINALESVLVRFKKF